MKFNAGDGTFGVIIDIGEYVNMTCPNTTNSIP